MIHRWVRMSLLAAALAAGVVAPVVSAVPGAVAAVGTVPAGPTVTLLTGDKVTVGGGMRGVRVRAAKGREHLTYTLRTTKTRPLARLSTEIEVAWTFASEHVTGEESVDLPMLAVRFAPDLDDHNTAPAGRRFTIPVYVQRNGSSEVGQVNTPSVEVSYDDGESWQPAAVNRRRGEWQATVDHPSGASSCR